MWLWSRRTFDDPGDEMMTVESSPQYVVSHTHTHTQTYEHTAPVGDTRASRDVPVTLRAWHR